MGNPDFTESEKKLRRLTRKKRNKNRKIKIQKKKKEQKCKKWINVSEDQNQGDKKRVREKTNRLAAEIVNWKHFLIERAAWNSQAAVLGPEKKIINQENIVNFLL